MVLVDLRAPFEHVQVIRSNVGSELVEKCRDVQNEPISFFFFKVLSVVR
jgi:hypothetical protein